MVMNSAPPAIEAKGVGFAFGANQVLSDVSFQVECGARFSIIGPNGSGKTTLIKLINRILKTDSGAIRIHGKAHGEYNQKELARLIGYVPQSNGSLFPYTVRDFTLMGRYPHVNPFTNLTLEDERAASDAMELTGVTEFADRVMGSLSGGERQKVYISAALAQGARTLLLDEPTTFLDPKAHDDVLDILERVNNEMGVTIVSVTHDINSAVIWSHKIMALKRGEVAMTGEPSDIMNATALEKIYGKKFLFATHPKTGGPMIVPDRY